MIRSGLDLKAPAPVVIRLGFVGADEVDALFDVVDVVVPLRLVFDRERSVETEADEFVEHFFDFAGAGAERNVGRGKVCAVFQVRADDAVAESLNGCDWVESAGEPVSGVCACSDARIAIFDDAEHPLGVPVQVVRVFLALWMVVETHLDIVLTDKLFNGIQSLRWWLGVDNANAHRLAKLEDFSGGFFIF